MNLKQKLGKKIQYLRKNNRMTQDQLAEIIGMDTKNISRIENGNNYPTAENLTLIANALEVDVFELFVTHEIPYDEMKQEVLNALEDKKKTLYLYQCLKAPNI